MRHKVLAGLPALLALAAFAVTPTPSNAATVGLSYSVVVSGSYKVINMAASCTLTEITSSWTEVTYYCSGATAYTPIPHTVGTPGQLPGQNTYTDPDTASFPNLSSGTHTIYAIARGKTRVSVSPLTYEDWVPNGVSSGDRYPVVP